MIILKSVIRYPDTNSVEATWVDQETSAATTDANGDAVPAVVTETQVRCHSYDQTQMAMLTSDLGADAATYAALIAQVSANLIVPPAPTLAQAQAAQMAILSAAYQNAIVQPVAFTSAAGVAQTYQADPGSQNNLLLASTGYTFAGAAPTGFYWVASDNSHVPFALADLHGLYLAMLAQGQMAFAHLQAQKAAVLEATTVAAVLAINW